MKYVVYFEEWSGCYAEEVFTSKESAEEYINNHKNNLLEEENYFILETNGDWATELIY